MGFPQTSVYTECYAALRSSDLVKIDRQLSLLSGTKPDDQAMKGALLMKRSGLIKDAPKKLQDFKKGKQLLEDCISKNDSPEYHFLRLMIQEHAPSALNYNNNMEADAKVVKSAFPTLDGDLQQEILVYSNDSKHLKLGE